MELKCDYCGKKIKRGPTQTNRAEYHYCSKDHATKDRKDRAKALKSGFG